MNEIHSIQDKNVKGGAKEYYIFFSFVTQQDEQGIKRKQGRENQDKIKK